MTPEPIEKAAAGEVETLSRRYRSLLAAVRSPAGADNQALWDELARTEKALEDARAVREAEPREKAARAQESKGVAGALLGPETTGLKVTTAVRLDPIPTGIYHLLDPATHPLLTVTLNNESHESRRVCVTAYLEGVSARAIQTVELARMERGRTISLLPSLRPGAARRITQVQRATLHVIVTIFGSTRGGATRSDWSTLVESHDTQSVVMLSRNSSFNGVIDPSTGLPPEDLSRYYGAWVTPHIESIQDVVRQAAELTPDLQIFGYQGAPEGVPGQVEALYNALKKHGIRYVNSTIDFGTGPGLVTQRTRLPRESLRHRCANCIDGTVLFASLLESASLHAGIVLIPGHAFVAWEKWPETEEWDYLETTMIGTADFAAANARGREQYQRWFGRKAAGAGGAKAVLLGLNELRKAKVWPME